jgi:hypothetical protein
MHRLIKTFYGATNKKELSKQLAKQERRNTHVRRQQQSIPTDSEGDAHSNLEVHHNLSDQRAATINLAEFLREHHDDPAVKVRGKVAVFNVSD